MQKSIFDRHDAEVVFAIVFVRITRKQGIFLRKHHTPIRTLAQVGVEV